MCTLGEGIYLKGKTEGKLEGKLEGLTQGKLNTVLELIRNNIITKEDALKYAEGDEALLCALGKELSN